MVQERVSGNGNFDIDAIRMAANAMENPPAVIEQPFVDPVADAFAADVQDTADEIRYNPSSNLAEEAMQIMNAPGAAKLGAGVLADLRAAVQLQEEKAANGADAFMRGDRVWEERKERDDKDRKEQARISDMADDANNGQLSTTPDRHGLSEQNYADLNTELQTRDGQERFMNFMRMMNPGMSDADIRKYAHDAEVIAAVRSGRATDGQRDEYDAMDPTHRDNVTDAMRRFRESSMENGNAPLVANRADAQAVEVSADAPSYDPQATTEASLNILAGGNASGATTLTRTSLTAQVEGQGDFAATAPSLRDHHRAALAATAPLDQPAPQVIASAAPVAPVAPVNAGFDV